VLMGCGVAALTMWLPIDFLRHLALVNSGWAQFLSWAGLVYLFFRRVPDFLFVH